jgi:hypothetical protein
MLARHDERRCRLFGRKRRARLPVDGSRAAGPPVVGSRPLGPEAVLLLKRRILEPGGEDQQLGVAIGVVVDGVEIVA